MSSRILELAGLRGVDALKAVASESRLRILMLLSQSDLNIHEIAQALGLTQPSVTRHVNVLEDAGLVRSEWSAGIQGVQKRCHLCFDRFLFSFEDCAPPFTQVEEIEMPIGLYTQIQATPTCGLASREKTIWWPDDAQAFYQPERATAEMLWTAAGFVEYVFPNTLPPTVDISRVDLILEICSEANNYDNEYPSDITVWINGKEVSTWTSPGDMGNKRGRLNPIWWHDHNTQYGFLKCWSVDRDGTHLDGTQVSCVTLETLGVQPRHPIVVRIGNKADARHVGGFNLFGRGFGNHEQGLVLRLHYVAQATAPDAGESGGKIPTQADRTTVSKKQGAARC